MNSKKIIAILLCTLFIFSAVNLVNAVPATTATVWGSVDGQGTVTSVVKQGDIVTIYWDCAPAGSTVSVMVAYSVDENSVEVPVEGASWTNLNTGDNGTKTFTADEIGIYWIYCYGAPFKLKSIASVLVTPESALGSIMAIGAGIAAFGAIGVVKKRHSKAKKA